MSKRREISEHPIYAEGWWDQRAGRAINRDCPFPWGQELWSIWRTGWKAAQSYHGAEDIPPPRKGKQMEIFLVFLFVLAIAALGWKWEG